MKKSIVLLLAMTFLLVMVGCNKGNEKSESKPESLEGYITIEENTLYMDKVEVITQKDTERIAALGLEQQKDMPNGYCFYNPEIDKEQFKLTDKTEYTFVDSNLLFIKEKDKDGNRLCTTTKKEEFIQHLNTSYADSPPAQKVPFFIQVKDGKVISITEKFEFTI